MNNRSAENETRPGNDIEDPTLFLAAQGGDMAAVNADFAAWPGIELNTLKTRLLRGKEQLKQLLMEPNTASAVSNPAMPRQSTAPGPALSKSRR